MKTLSFDVGIKNLAYCFIDTDSNQIFDWGVIDLFASIVQSTHAPTCVNRIGRQKKICDKPACFTYSQTDSETLQICKTCDKKIASDYSQWSRKTIKGSIKTTKDIGLQDYGRAIKDALEQKAATWNDCELILIENQPVLKNPTMKSIQMILFSYFAFNYDCPIVLYAARNKLSVAGIKTVSVENDDTGKKAYSQRKAESKAWVKTWLSGKEKWIQVFDDATKKDDLADCLIQALSYSQKRKTA